MENRNIKIIEKLMQILFDNLDEINFETLNRKFEKDKLFLTSGYIREIVLNLFQFLSLNKLE